MSKHVFSFLALSFVLLTGLYAPVHADAYAEGVAAYKSKSYARAAQLLESAMKQGRPNANMVFYLGMAYTHLNKYESARQAFDLVIQMVPPNDELAAKARNNISFITKQQISLASNSGKASEVMKTSLSRNSKDNYLTHVIPGGKVVHFSSSRMPLKVFISNGTSVKGWNINMRQAVAYAMQAWQSASRGKVSFAQTYSEANADIIVKWHKNFTDGILGVSPLETVGDTIIRSDVNLAVYYPDSNVPIPMNDLKAIAVHEMGHAIGIRGHSPYPDDIMFFSKTRSQNTLSQRDMNTVGMLYKLDADVKNNTNMSTAQTKKYYELYQLGLQAQTGNDPAKAIAYYRQAMQISAGLPEAKFNLGALLINARQQPERGKEKF
jgi:predicted Zn-dependent protease